VYYIRSIGPMDVNKLLRKTLACFCYFYVDPNFSACENLAWIEHWQVEMLILNSMDMYMVP
jgi:hypothetical protein